MLLEQKEKLLQGLISNYLDTFHAGGNLHIVLEDGNFDDDSIVFCKRRCRKAGDAFGVVICGELLSYEEGLRKGVAWGDDE